MNENNNFSKDELCLLNHTTTTNPDFTNSRSRNSGSKDSTTPPSTLRPTSSSVVQGLSMPPTFKSIPRQCFCVQEHASLKPSSKSEIQEKAEETRLKIVKELTINKTSTSANVRSKTSAVDVRPSAQTVGYIGVGMMVLVGTLIVGPDCIGLVMWMYRNVFVNKG